MKTLDVILGIVGGLFCYYLYSPCVVIHTINNIQNKPVVKNQAPIAEALPDKLFNVPKIDTTKVELPKIGSIIPNKYNISKIFSTGYITVENILGNIYLNKYRVDPSDKKELQVLCDFYSGILEEYNQLYLKEFDRTVDELEKQSKLVKFSVLNIPNIKEFIIHERKKDSSLSTTIRYYPTTKQIGIARKADLIVLDQYKQGKTQMLNQALGVVSTWLLSHGCIDQEFYKKVIKHI
jgi:hypothetical protein